MTRGGAKGRQHHNLAGQAWENSTVIGKDKLKVRVQGQDGVGLGLRTRPCGAQGGAACTHDLPTACLQGSVVLDYVETAGDTLRLTHV